MCFLLFDVLPIWPYSVANVNPIWHHHLLFSFPTPKKFVIVVTFNALRVFYLETSKDGCFG